MPKVPEEPAHKRGDLMGFEILILYILIGVIVGVLSAINESFLTFYLYGWAATFVISGIIGYTWG